MMIKKLDRAIKKLENAKVESYKGKMARLIIPKECVEKKDRRIFNYAHQLILNSLNVSSTKEMIEGFQVKGADGNIHFFVGRKEEEFSEDCALSNNNFHIKKYKSFVFLLIDKKELGDKETENRIYNEIISHLHANSKKDLGTIAEIEDIHGRIGSLITKKI